MEYKENNLEKQFFLKKTLIIGIVCYLEMFSCNKV